MKCSGINIHCVSLLQCNLYLAIIFSPLFQSPSSALISEGVNENPNLTDNWDDTEGYYRK